MNLPLKLCMGWGLGTLGISVMFNSMNILMQRFATDYLGIMAVTWGYIYLGSKIYDALTDPVMGLISDKTRSRWGRRRPYLIAGGIFCALAFYGLFHAPSSSESIHAVLIMVCLMLLYSTGYTVFNVPYMAMPAEMTEDYHARSHLVSFRVYAIGLGTIAGISLAPFLISYFGGGRAGHQSMALIYALVILSASIGCFFLTRNARETQPEQDPDLSFSQRLQLVVGNRPFVLLICVKFLHLAALALNQTVLIYFIVYVLDRGYVFLGTYGLIVSISMMLGPPVCLYFLRRHEKQIVFIFASLVYALLMCTWHLSGPDEATLVLFIRGALLGMAGGGMLMIGQAMLPDTIAYDAQRTGLRREGIFAGLYTTAEKLAFATGGAFAAFILGTMGYISSTTGYAEQPESAITAIFICMGILPAVFIMLSCLFLIPYDLNAEKLASGQARISI